MVVVVETHEEAKALVKLLGLKRWFIIPLRDGRYQVQGDKPSVEGRSLTRVA